MPSEGHVESTLLIHPVQTVKAGLIQVEKPSGQQHWILFGVHGIPHVQVMTSVVLSRMDPQRVDHVLRLTVNQSIGQN